jgi:stress response protein YsnF
MSYQRSLMILWMLAMAAFVAALAGCTSLTMGSDYDRAAVFSNCHRARLWADAKVGVRAGAFESVSATSEGWKGFDAGAAPVTDEERALQRKSLPVVEEVHIGKRTVDPGGLRVIKRLSETPVSQVINLRQQKATVERKPVDRPATEADFQNFREGTFEVRETAEEAVIGKTARVVEEVAVRQIVTSRAETVSDTVRKTNVDVERVHSIDEPSADVRKPSL